MLPINPMSAYDLRVPGGFNPCSWGEALPAFATSSLGSTWRLGGRGGPIPLGTSRTNAWRGFTLKMPPPEEPLSMKSIPTSDDYGGPCFR
jgi:hypothetical protein